MFRLAPLEPDEAAYLIDLIKKAGDDRPALMAWLLVGFPDTELDKDNEPAVDTAVEEGTRIERAIGDGNDLGGREFAS